MELERNHTFFHCFDTIVDTILFREETSESIVPDACPDISRIAAADGNAFLMEKHAYEGKCEVNGEARISVMYVSEGESLLRHMEVVLPFVCAVEQGGITSGSSVFAVPQLRSVDARTLNPRKILVRAEVAVQVKVCTSHEHQLLSSLTEESAAGIQQQATMESTFLTVCVEEKEFPFSDELKLPATPCRELLSSRILPSCSEAKVIGNKLILKGQARLEVVYSSENGLENAQFELPFSQIMEVSNAGEESFVTVLPTPIDLSCTLAGEGGSHLAVSMRLLAQAMVEEERTLTVLQDAYSTVFESAITAETLSICRLADRVELPVAFRETLSCDTRVHRVADCHVVLGQVSVTEEQGIVHLSVPITIHALCQDEQDTFFSISGTFPVHCQRESMQGSMITAHCHCVGEIYATPTAGGVEARVPLSFTYVAIRKKQLAVVGDLTLKEDMPCHTTASPSLILRPVMEHERLWDIAKGCRTTVSDIVKVNNLPDETAVPGQMLLISKHC